MEEQLISLKTAKLAKKKGLTYEDIGQSFRSNGDFTYGRNDEHFFPAPTQSILQKWLREIHKIYIMVEPLFKQNEDLNFYGWRGCKNVYPSTIGGIGNTYEEALEKGLQDGLKLIIKKYGRKISQFPNC